MYLVRDVRQCKPGKVMSDDEAKKAMGDHHDLVEGGRREIYKIEG